MLTAEVVGVDADGRRAGASVSDPAVEQHQSRDTRGMRRGVEISEIHAAAEARYEDAVASGRLHYKAHRRVDVRLEQLVGPARQLGQSGLRCRWRHKMRAIVERPGVNAVCAKIERQRVLRIVDR